MGFFIMGGVMRLGKRTATTINLRFFDWITVVLYHRIVACGVFFLSSNWRKIFAPLVLAPTATID
jgi:hypothetical protein